ncbi:MAG: DUF899 domain-containing protein [Pseudobacteriovorax sp.]|nr:DUF899 domain-containing protein [Pseudobacteriovorax sp.]
MKNTPLPPVTSHEDWQQHLAEITRLEKEHTRIKDQINAKRRLLPMYEVDSTYRFETENGEKTLLDLFDGRKQLIVYHFMFDTDWEQGCDGCSWVVDAMSHPAHLHVRSVSLVLVSKAPLSKLLSYKKRMGWTLDWVSSQGSSFNSDFGATVASGENHGVSVFICNDRKVYRTYFTTARGVEHLGSHWTYLDLTPYGRQEDWEKSPVGWPQHKKYTIEKRHDAYQHDGRVKE